MWVHGRVVGERESVWMCVRAPQGSKKMFLHLVNKQMTVQWNYGPVTCRKLRLDGFDVGLENTVLYLRGSRIRQ